MKKLFIPISDWRVLDPQILPGIANRLKIHITPILDNSTHVLSFIDSGNYNIINDPKYDFVKPYTKDALISITDKVEMGNLPLSTLSTIVPYNTDDVLGFSEGPVFLKRRRTYVKEHNNPLAYTSWDSGIELDNKVGSELYNQQQFPHPIFGEYILQPKLSYPIHEVAITVSVNEHSDVIVSDIVVAADIGSHMRTDAYSDTHNKSKYQATIDKIQDICKLYSIKNCIHAVQFAVSETGDFVLVDWNLRPTLNTMLFAAKLYPVLDQAIAHMMSVPCSNNQIYYHKVKVFSITGGIPNTKLLPGLGIKTDYKGASFDEVRVYGIAESEVELSDLFNKFMEVNNII